MGNIIYNSKTKFIKQDLNDYTTNVVTEAVLKTLEIEAGRAPNGFIVMATGRAKDNGTSTNAFIRIRAGNSSTFSSNTLFKTINRMVTLAKDATLVHGWAMNVFVSPEDIDLTQKVYVNITGQNSVNAGGPNQLETFIILAVGE